jgi:hypothetical protein
VLTVPVPPAPLEINLGETYYSPVDSRNDRSTIHIILLSAAYTRHDGYSCLSAILRRFLGWSYRMWVGQSKMITLRCISLRAPLRGVRRKRRGRGG